MKKWKIAGISFDHMHMGDLLREAGSHPRAEIAGIADDNPENAESLALVRETLGIPVKSLHTDISTRTGERIIVFTLERTYPN